MDGYTDVSDTNMVINKIKDEFLIKEISQKYRIPSQKELDQIKKLSSPSTTYDPKKGLGARYLGGGYFNSSTSISPDNTKIVFSSLKNESSDIYTMNLDGSNLKRLTTSSYWEVLPSFTPDGQHILFLSDHENYQGEPYILSIANGQVRRFIPQMHNVRNIVFFPERNIAAFTATQGECTEIFIKDCNSNGIRQLTRTGHDKISLVFTSDGKNLFFSEQWYEYDKAPPRTVELFSLTIDGNDIRQLTNDRYYKKPVTYTTDKQLFYIRQNDDYDNELWVMNNDHPASRRIVSAVHGMGNAWVTPDESAILFEDDRSKPYEYDVFSVNTNYPYKVKRITNFSSHISNLSFSKNGRFITFIAEISNSDGRGKGEIILFDLVNGSQKKLGKNY
ncbi:MAG: TolB family protein [Planctomycetota bacterium]